MYKKEELEKKTRDEVRKIAKEFKIPKWGKMTKVQMIEEIIKTPEEAEIKPEVVESAKVDNMINEIKTQQSDSAGISDNVNFDSKLKYLREIKKGTIVAFRTTVYGKTRYKSAAVENYNQSKQLLKLVTKYGAEYIIPFKDVIWVRTNGRWPKAVYCLLKGVNNDASK